jgi:CheY-like chemotaxis protein
LVIDDEPHIRSFAAVLLEDLGYECLEAESGRAGVQSLLQDPDSVSAVLLDMTMPGLSAEDTLRMLTEICPGLPVVILSGDAEHRVRARFREGSLAGYIYKPDMDAVLEATLKRVLVHEDAPVRDQGTKVSRLERGEVEAMRFEYLEACRTGIAKMAGMLEAGDFEGLRVMGHTLKGSGGCFGLTGLTLLGRALEASAKAANGPDCQTHLDEIGRELARIEDSKEVPA